MESPKTSDSEQLLSSSKSTKDTDYNLKLSDSLATQLKERFPEVMELISKLRQLIEKQRKKIKKLKSKHKKKRTKDVSTQTEDIETTQKSLVDEITEAAEAAVQKQGFVYEETSGLYYDYNSGYYYNAELGLYYDGNTGSYLRYNSDTQSYEVYSQATPEPATQAVEDRTRSKRKIQNRKSSKGSKRERTGSDCTETADLEEGECSESSHSERSEDAFDDANHLHFTDIAKAWPPCMRIIVKSTTVSKLREGSLYIITYEGGSLGREGDHAVTIPDINISKHHLKFTFNMDTSQFFVTDLGSRNGTLLNGKRISASKQESDPCELTHGSQVQVGATVLLCHIHSGNETCGHCEPGLLQINENSKDDEPVRTNKNDQHRRELLKLRKKFGIIASDSTQLAAGYVDRAEARRKTVGSHNDHEKTQVASVDQSISSENKGFKLLSKMGWSEGQSLGKEGTGVVKPVELVPAIGTAGIGYKGPAAAPKSKPTQTKQNIWEKTAQRYEQLVSPSASPDETY